MTTTTTPVFVSTVEPEHRPGIAGVARSEWTKIRSLRSTFWTFLVTAVLTIGLGSLFALGRTSAHPGRDAITASFNAAGFPFNAMFLSQLAIGVLGVLIITTEYSSGMIRTTFTAVPQRGIVLAVKAVIFGAVTFVVSILTTFVTFFAAQAVLSRGTPKYGVSLSSPQALRIVIGAALYLTVCALLGVALGALPRSTAAAITGLAGLLFILPIMTNFLPSSWHRDTIAQWLPSNAGMQIVQKVAQPLQFSPWAGLAVFAGWVAVAFVAGAVLLRRRVLDVCPDGSPDAAACEATRAEKGRDFGGRSAGIASPSREPARQAEHCALKILVRGYLRGVGSEKRRRTASVAQPRH